MDGEIRIKLDDATILQATDGTVTFTPRKAGGCVTMGLLIVTALVAAGGIALTVTGIIQLVKHKAEVNGGGVIFGFFMAAMFSLFAYYLYRKMRARRDLKEISISPIINVVKVGDRVIPFNDIVDIATKVGPIPILEGAVAIQFGLALKNSEIVVLGNKAMDAKSPEKIEKLKTETLTLLKNAIRRN